MYLTGFHIRFENRLSLSGNQYQTEVDRQDILVARQHDECKDI